MPVRFCSRLIYNNARNARGAEGYSYKKVFRRYERGSRSSYRKATKRSLKYR